MCAHKWKKKVRGLIIFPETVAIHKPECPSRSHTLNLCFLYRAGYLTLFGGEQNNNGSDPSRVYEEYKKFDGLLTKMARGTLKTGNVDTSP